MGFGRLLIWTISIFFASALFNTCLAGNNVILEKQPWPVTKKSEICVPVQFGKLGMCLPLSEIGRILVIGSGDSVLHILPKTDDPQTNVLFQTVTSDRLMQTYKKLGLLQGLCINTNEQFFDALGKLPGENKSLETMRRVEQIDSASRYLKTSKESVSVYWVQSRIPGGSQRVYFVIDAEETVYLLAGNVTREFYEAVLASLKIVDIP